jgi:hypothetical protein
MKEPNHRRQQTPRFRSARISRQWRGAAAAERYMRSRVSRFLSVAVLLLLVMGCGKQARQPARPAELERVAAQFRAKGVLTDRYEEAAKLIYLLPACPELSRNDTGLGVTIHYDYSKPSYKLFKADILQVLGQPERSDDVELRYKIAADGHLVIMFHDGYAVKSFVYGPRI